MSAHAATPPPTLDRRRAGILLHPTSLPGARVHGALGPSAAAFVDLLCQCGASVWQMLPVGPTHGDLSPYQSLSAFAGDPALLSPRPLVEAGWLDGEPQAPVSTGELPRWRRGWLASARARFEARASEGDRAALDAFTHDSAHWLDDFALFAALRVEQDLRGWWDWPEALRDRAPGALEEARAQLAPALQQVRFEQFLFHRQWHALKAYANERGVLLFGDMPLFVAEDSADVWACREQFRLGADGRPEVVAGTPPDYFSETGQRWGNPLYDWDVLREDGFGWWQQRVLAQEALFDLIRVDHFRGFEAYWEIPGTDSVALNGRWVQAPGAELFAVLLERTHALPLVAEDLGLITPEVTALRERFGIPGMKILQFAFDGNRDNPYLPHNHERNSVVYTGTHDNDTTLGWYQALPPDAEVYLRAYLGEPGDPMPWPLVRAALASVALLAVLPLQDLLAVGSEHRMNVPGVPAGNWTWSFEWDAVDPVAIERFRALVALYGRHAGCAPRRGSPG